jgi:quinol monooxygenase YgiN
MLLFRVRIQLDAQNRTQVLQSLMRILEPTRARTGCISCVLCCDIEEKNAIVLIEEWATQEHLEARFQQDSLRVVLAAMDCAVCPPQVRIDTISETKGLEMIAECRASQSPV